MGLHIEAGFLSYNVTLRRVKHGSNSFNEVEI